MAATRSTKPAAKAIVRSGSSKIPIAVEAGDFFAFTDGLGGGGGVPIDPIDGGGGGGASSILGGGGAISFSATFVSGAGGGGGISSSATGIGSGGGGGAISSSTGAGGSSDEELAADTAAIFALELQYFI